MVPQLMGQGEGLIGCHDTCQNLRAYFTLHLAGMLAACAMYPNSFNLVCFGTHSNEAMA